MLAHQLDRLAQKNRWSRDFTLNSLRHALREVIACFPVYRSYITDDGVARRGPPATSRGPCAGPRRATRASAGRCSTSSATCCCCSYPESAGEEDRAEQRRFAGKFQQVTAPVMAKGVEDTAFYVYNRLLSLNEVGGDPARFGVAPEAVHRFNQERQAQWPRGPVALVHARHQAQRGRPRPPQRPVGDAAGVAGVPGALEPAQRAAPRRTSTRSAVPDRNEEYLLYQTLLGAWPLEPCGARGVRRVRRSASRTYMLKALHEAKVHTSWINPNDDYDEAVRQFVARILDEELSGRFLRRLPGVPAAGQPFRAVQLAVADAAEDHRAGRARHLPGDRAVGLQPGRSGQPPAGGLRTPAGIAPGIAGSGGRGRAGSEGTGARN